ncbi:MAG: right-handed parallel beta-helix repeat-containing protein [Candidatus Schekmanbacteria bacterium]|nr:right-handed parallel beta-helix repeat-containing protein [Candidatus Schekmanbacteria bacterium]
MASRDRRFARNIGTRRHVAAFAVWSALAFLLWMAHPASAADTNWSGVQALSSDYTVNAGDRLIIAPGTRIQVAARAECPTGTADNETLPDCWEIIVRGELLADDPTGGAIVFSSNGTPSDWGGIAIRDGGKATLRGVTIRDAKVGVLADDAHGTAESPNVNIAFSSFDNNQYHAIWASGESHSAIANNLLRDHPAQLDGSVIKIYTSGDASTVVKNNLIFDNQEAGITVQDCSPSIVNNTFIGGEYGLFLKGSTALPDVRNNIFSEYTFFGIGCDAGFLGNPDPIVEFNNVHSTAATSKPIGFGDDYWQPCGLDCPTTESNPSACGAFTGGANISTGGAGLFVDAAQHDYMLPVGSPSVDAGDPNLQYTDASWVVGNGNENRNDQGAYGGPGASPRAGAAVPLLSAAAAALSLGAIGRRLRTRRMSARSPGAGSTGRWRALFSFRQTA